ncbi:unnamed protein product [Penicillium salamii]|uniref:Uncharacterized protein n=1 Tax=Penicillium salamii TaxID=1612424 RepID=A0A9W4JQS5_9EURO|nr:unnamed protein product [Penicillium salamii]
MSAPSWAFLHGFKAVHVPQPIYVDGKWTSAEMARIFNRGTPENINGGQFSIWNWDHKFDYLWYRLSFMVATQTAEDMFRRWLGFPPNPSRHLSGERDEPANGRMCLPFMLLHTIKNTEPEMTSNLPVTDSALQDDAI